MAATVDGGVTPLMAAAGMLTQGFVQAGTDRRGRAIDTAEMELALRQDPDQRRLMSSGIDAVKVVSQGANLDAMNARGETPLERAMRNDALAPAKSLVAPRRGP